MARQRTPEKPAENAGETAAGVENRLRERRTLRGWSQSKLAAMAGVTRQSVGAVESGQYSPATSVALRLARALQCRVEDLFSLSGGGRIEGDWLGPAAPASTRVKAIRVGRRVLVQPVAALGGPGGFAESADGLLAARPKGSRAEVLLLRDRRAIDRQIVVAGCNPAMFLAADYLKRRPEEGSLLVRTMGSEAAFAALARGEAHVAGLHILDERSGESNLPYLRRNLKRLACLIVTFAAWEQGLIVAGGNPKRIRAIDDLARRDVRLLNRETGSGARRLLDRRLARAGIESKKVRGYDRSVGSHLDIAWGVREGLADAGIGVAAAAVAFGLDFVPLQEERYDLVIPTEYMDLHPALAVLLDTITSRPFRSEVEAMGGYDTREAGKVVEMNTQEQR